MNNANESIDSNKSGRREKQIRAHKVTADWRRERERGGVDCGVVKRFWSLLVHNRRRPYVCLAFVPVREVAVRGANESFLGFARGSHIIKSFHISIEKVSLAHLHLGSARDLDLDLDAALSRLNGPAHADRRAPVLLLSGLAADSHNYGTAYSGRLWMSSCLTRGRVPAPMRTA